MAQSTKSHLKPSPSDFEYPKDSHRTSKAAEPLSDEERVTIDDYYKNEAEENAGSISAEELLARLRRK